MAGEILITMQSLSTTCHIALILSSRAVLIGAVAEKQDQATNRQILF
jgi:hypothetical protein